MLQEVSPTAPSTGPFSVGIIGATNAVRDSHLPVLLTIENLRVAWLTDHDATRARSVASPFGVAVEPLPEELTSLPDADIYVIAGASADRRDLIHALSARGSAILVERPFASSPGEHREISSWLPEYSLGIGLITRNWGPVIQTKELIESQLFRELETVRIGYGFTAMPRPAHGATLVTEAIDNIDAALFAMGARAIQLERICQESGDEDYMLSIDAVLRVETDAGGVACEIVLSHLHDTIEGLEFEFKGAKVSYPMPGQGYALLGEEVNRAPLVQPLRGGSPFRLIPIAGHYPMNSAQTYQDYWAKFLKGIHEKRANTTSASSAIVTTEVLEALTTGQAPRREESR